MSAPDPAAVPHCCYLLDQASAIPEHPCPHVAEWEIHFSRDPMRPTHACTAHIGALLSDDPEHRIYPLPVAR